MTKAFPLKSFTDKSVYNNNINNKSFLLKCKLNIPLGNKSMSWYWLEARRTEEERKLLGKNLLFLLCWQQGLGFHLQTGSMVHLGWAGCSVLGAWTVCASPGHNVLLSSGKTVRWIAVLNWALLCPSMESLPFILIWGSTMYGLSGASSSIHTAGCWQWDQKYWIFLIHLLSRHSFC